MKWLNQLTALTFLLLLGWGCTEDSPALEPEPSMTLIEEMDNDGGHVVRRDEFYYDEANRLTHHRIKQVFTVKINNYEDTDSLSLENRVTYSGHEVTITEASGSTATYTLNNDGYATGCIRREDQGTFVRTYTFAYSPELYLTELTEIVNETVQSRLTLQPQTGGNTFALSIVSGGGDYNSTFLLTPDQENRSRLPWLFLTERYPLSLHQDALYAGILGKAPQQLVHTIEPEGGTEKTTYTYTTDKAGNLSSCYESIRGNSFINTRKVQYIIR